MIGLGQIFFGTAGFLVVVIVRALASAASSAVLVGSPIPLMGAATATLAMVCATCVGLLENVVIFYVVTHNRTMSFRFVLLLLPVVMLGIFSFARFVARREH